MADPFRKTYDEILNEILTDFRNIFPGVDTAKGTLAFMKAAGYASTMWGLYRYQEWISNQIFPDMADSEQMEHHAWVRGLPRKPGEDDPDLLARLLAYIRRPPAGGNQYDYVKWALDIADVRQAISVPLGQGLGTVDVIILADPDTTGSEIPSADLLAATRAYIVGICPTAVKYLRVLAPTVITQDVAMTVTGPNLDRTQIAADIADYMSGLLPMQDLVRAQLVNIAVADGAEDVEITTPAANVSAADYGLIRPGVINVG